jgi:hypothetical protein
MQLKLIDSVVISTVILVSISILVILGLFVINSASDVMPVVLLGISILAILGFIANSRT